MKVAFFVIAAAMILATILLTTLPLWRRGGTGQRPSRPLAVVLAVLIPLAAVLIYLSVGQPVTLNGVPREDPAQQQLINALTKLENHLKEQPGDTRGWLLLGQTLSAIRQPQAALDAYQHALENAPDNVNAMVGWAEMSAMTRPDHLLADRARSLLQHAVQADPKNQRALWLLGISDYQEGRYAEAIGHWKALQPLLSPDSEIGKVVSSQLQDAEKQLARQGGARAATAAPAAADAPHGPSVSVSISLSPALQSRLKPGDMLFVFARAPSGPPMPLAATRLPASALPARITLTDAMAMMPGHDLSAASQIIVGARISHGGQALPAAGDLEGQSAPLSLPAADTVHVLIDKVD